MEWILSLRLQQLISTALLETVDADDPELVLQYENIVVAGKYLVDGGGKVTAGVTGDEKGVEFDSISQADIIIQYSSDGAVSVVQVSQTSPDCNGSLSYLYSASFDDHFLPFLRSRCTIIAISSKKTVQIRLPKKTVRIKWSHPLPWSQQQAVITVARWRSHMRKSRCSFYLRVYLQFYVSHEHLSKYSLNRAQCLSVQLGTSQTMVRQSPTHSPIKI